MARLSERMTSDREELGQDQSLFAYQLVNVLSFLTQIEERVTFLTFRIESFKCLSCNNLCCIFRKLV